MSYSAAAKGEQDNSNKRDLLSRQDVLEDGHFHAAINVIMFFIRRWNVFPLVCRGQ